MEQLVMVTAMCRAADDGGLPGWAHWACLDAPASDAPSYLRSGCTCWCHGQGEAALPPVPGEYLVQVPQHRRDAAARRAHRAGVA